MTSTAPSSRRKSEQVLGDDADTAHAGPWATLDTPVAWPLRTKVWTYAFGWLLQTVFHILTFDRDVRALFRKHRRSIWIDTKETGRCRLVLHYPRKPARDASTRDASTGAPGIVVHSHGGGWTIFRPETEYGIAQRMADELGTVVVSPDYRKSPWYPYPHALLQSYAVLTWLASGGLDMHPATPHFAVDPSRIALTGGSAGGNLAASLTLLCLHRPLPNDARIVGLGLLYPVLDLSTPYVSKLSGFDPRLILPPWFSRFILHAYMPPPRDVRDPYVSPLVAVHADLQRFPTTAVVTTNEDYLSTEGEAFATKLEECGVPVVRRRFEEVGHAFDLLPTVDFARMRRNAKATHEAHGIFALAFKDVLTTST